MNTYRARIKRETASKHQLDDLNFTIDAPTAEEGRSKALNHAYWQTKRHGIRAEFTIVEFEEYEGKPDVDPARDLLARAIDVVGVSPYVKSTAKVPFPVSPWHGRCHEISLMLIKAGLFGDKARVARGWCDKVRSQHSWIAVSGDCYDISAQIVDPTLHANDPNVHDILWTGSLRSPGWHHPHGQGNIWKWGRPYHHGNKTITFERTKLSVAARTFLDMIEPLDMEGWRQLVHAPMEGWPSGEIIDWLCDTPVGSFIPIDIKGMLTDRNPKGMYR